MYLEVDNPRSLAFTRLRLGVPIGLAAGLSVSRTVAPQLHLYWLLLLQQPLPLCKTGRLSKRRK